MELPSKPLSYVVKIIKIDKSKKLDRKLQLKSLKRNLIDFSIDRTEENEGTICIKGAQFYDEMSEVLKGFSLDKIKKENKIKFFIFAGALNAGGEAFYRYDFLQSLLSKGIEGKRREIDYAIDRLKAAIKMWYELARKLRFVQKSEDTKIDEIFMVNLLDEIKKSELEAINILLQNYEILEEILCCGK